MRIRQVKPSFWSDPTVARLPDPARLFYIGLWNMADDSGWIAWETAEAGALLYPYRPPARRERDMTGWMDQLANARRVVRYSCGCVEVPNLPEHQRISGVQSHKVREQHERAHPDATPLPLTAKQDQLSAPTKQSPLSDSPVKVGNGSEMEQEGYTTPLKPLTRARLVGLHGPVNPREKAS